MLYFLVSFDESSIIHYLSLIHIYANELEKLGNFINDDAVLTKLVDIRYVEILSLL